MTAAGSRGLVFVLRSPRDSTELYGFQGTQFGNLCPGASPFALGSHIKTVILVLSWFVLLCLLHILDVLLVVASTTFNEKKPELSRVTLLTNMGYMGYGWGRKRGRCCFKKNSSRRGPPEEDDGAVSFLQKWAFYFQLCYLIFSNLTRLFRFSKSWQEKKKHISRV